MTGAIRSVAVYVATTGGPVRILQITEEPAVRSVVCVGRTATPLPISDDYDNFVQPGLGPVGRTFGAPVSGAYRMDVGSPIAGGLSWQAAFYIAHAVFHAPDLRLAGSDETPWHTLLVTGQVDFDGQMGAVQHIAAKITAATPWIKEQIAKEHAVTVAVPEANRAEAAEAIRTGALGSEDGPAESGIRLLSASDISELLEPIRRTRDRAKPGSNAPVRTSAKSQRNRNIPLIAVLMLAGIGAAFYNSFEDYGAISPEPTAIKDDPPIEPAQTAGIVATRDAPLSLALFEWKPPPAYTCADVQFQRVRPVKTPVSLDANRSFETSKNVDLCALEFQVTPQQPSLFMQFSLEFLKGDVIRSVPLPPVFEGLTAVAAPASWHVDLPYFLPEEIRYKINLVVDDKPIPETGLSQTPAWPALIWNHRVSLESGG